MTYSASIQWLGDRVGVLRVHLGDDGHWKTRSPYTWACTIHDEGNTATLMGVTKAPTIREAAAIAKVLRQDGFADMRHERCDGQDIRIVTHTL